MYLVHDPPDWELVASAQKGARSTVTLPNTHLSNKIST
jgi:hypothetical protein